MVTDLRKCPGSSSPNSSISNVITDRDLSSQVAVLPCCWSINLVSKNKPNIVQSN